MQDERMNTGPGITVLGLCAWFGHKEAVSVLLSARADVDGGLFPPMCFAASSNQNECIKLLCAAGGNPKVSIIGGTPICWASLHGFSTCVSELISAGVAGVDGDGLSAALHFAAIHAGNAETVFALIDAKADVNEPWRPQSFLKWALRLHNLRSNLRTLSRRCRKDGTTRVVTIEELAYHCWEATPLMVAVICGQDEVSAALIAAGARLDLRNRRQKTALDLADANEVPEFLMKMLRGEENNQEMKDIVRMTISNRYPVSQSF